MPSRGLCQGRKRRTLQENTNLLLQSASVAKKSRTPPPPRRPVQAPKVRGGVRAPRPELDRRSRYILYGSAASGVVILAVVIALISTGGSKSSGKAAVVGQDLVGNMAKLPGVELGKPPWPPEYTHLRARLSILGIPALPQEALQVHTHSHLDVYVDGKRVTVPALVGIDIKDQFITPLHTHDPSGIVHKESPTQFDYTLGQFFGIWGLRLSKTCIGGLWATAGKPFKVWVNGHRFAGDPTRIVLEAHDEIALVYGTPPKKIPTSYTFPAGL